MSWRCALAFSLPVAFLFVVSLFLPEWQDDNGTSFGYESLIRSFQSRDGSFKFTTVLWNLVSCVGIVLLAVPKTWARAAAAAIGVTSVVLLIADVFIHSLVRSIFNSTPPLVGSGLNVRIGSMALMLLLGLGGVIVSSRRDRLARLDDSSKRVLDRFDNIDDRFNPRTRSEAERYQTDQDLSPRSPERTPD